MPFEKGHPGYPTRARRVSTKHLSSEIRERIPASIYVEFYLAVLQGKDPKIIEDEDTDSGMRVAWDERGGIPPTLEQKLQALKWLADRGYGQAPSVQHLEAVLRVEHSGASALPVGKLPPSTMHTIRAALQGALKSAAPPDPTSALPDQQALPATGETSEAIDAEFTEIPASEDGSAPDVQGSDESDESDAGEE